MDTLFFLNFISCCCCSFIFLFLLLFIRGRFFPFFSFSLSLSFTLLLLFALKFSALCISVYNFVQLGVVPLFRFFFIRFLFAWSFHSTRQFVACMAIYTQIENRKRRTIPPHYMSFLNDDAHMNNSIREQIQRKPNRVQQQQQLQRRWKKKTGKPHT